MAERFTITVDGEPLEVEAGWTVAVALWNAGWLSGRPASGGGTRPPLCAMGICFECRVTVGGERHRRGCLVPCAPGMEVGTRD